MATSKVQLKKEQQALKTLGFRNINHFVKNMKTPDKIKKRNEITPLTSTNLGLGLNDENSRIRERSESESPKLHEKKKTKKRLKSKQGRISDISLRDCVTSLIKINYNLVREVQRKAGRVEDIYKIIMRKSNKVRFNCLYKLRC